MGLSVLLITADAAAFSGQGNPWTRYSAYRITGSLLGLATKRPVLHFGRQIFLLLGQTRSERFDSKVSTHGCFQFPKSPESLTRQLLIIFFPNGAVKSFGSFQWIQIYQPKHKC